MLAFLGGVRVVWVGEDDSRGGGWPWTRPEAIGGLGVQALTMGVTECSRGGSKAVETPWVLAFGWEGHVCAMGGVGLA